MIRAATVEDSANIAALSIQVWLDTYATDGICNNLSHYALNHFTEQKVAENIDSSQHQYLLYTRAEQLLGFTLIKKDAHCPELSIKGAELDKLYVQERFTGQGIGSELIQATLAYCNTNHIKTLWLKVYHDNPRALKFYQKHQFENAGITWFELGGEKHKNYTLTRSTQ